MRFRLFIISIAFLLTAQAGAAEPLPDGAAFEVGFSPRGGALTTVLKGIQSARTSILVAAYSFTSEPIATALLEAHRRGIKV